MSMKRVSGHHLRLGAFVAGFLLFAATTCAAAQSAEDNPYLWQPRVTRVAVFKNGLGFFMGEGKVGLRDGWCLSKEVPPAAFGTLAIFAHDEEKVVDIVGSGPGETVDFDGRDAPDTLETRRERLDAAKNLKVELVYKQDGQDRLAAGKLRSVGTEYAILEADANTFAVPLAAVDRMRVLELPLRVHVASDSGDKPESATIGIGYLRKGIAWLPEYTLEIIDDETAQITLRGTLINEAEDLIDCEVNFVVGVPHFVHTDYMAPIAVGQVIRTIAASIAPSAVMSQMANRAAIVSNEDQARGTRIVQHPVQAAGDVGGALANLPRMEGPGATDYTVYAKKGLTVRRGEKAIVTLFSRTIRYSHVYRWSIPGAIEHSFVLENATDSSWTTGPCLALSGGRPLSEDLLKYVAKGASGEFPVTSAVNISKSTSESEVERKLKAHQPRSDYYLDLVTLKGEVKVQNFETTPVRLIVTAPIEGKPLTASDNGAMAVDTGQLTLLERKGSAIWMLNLGPGEAKALDYTYERYVPSLR